MSLKKTAELDTPHATFVNEPAGWEWRVLKVYRSAKSDKGDEYARWMMAVKSPNTFGSWEYGDTYINDVTSFGRLQSATQEFTDYYTELTS